jgi:hypothetical protein
MRGLRRQLSAGLEVLIEAEVQSEQMLRQRQAAERDQQNGNAARHPNPR